MAFIGQLTDDLDNGRVEELRLIDPHHVKTVFMVPDRLRPIDGHRGNGTVVMRDHMVFRVTIVHLGFEDHHTLTRDLGPPQTADQLFGLAREHATANDLDPTSLHLGIDSLL